MRNLTFFVYLFVFLQSISLAQDSFIWSESFEGGKIDGSKWMIISGSPLISSTSATPGSNSLKLSPGDTLETKFFPLDGHNKILFSFRYKNTNTEKGDDLVLWLRFCDGTSKTFQLTGDGPEYNSFLFNRYPILNFPCLDSLKIQIFMTGDDDYDHWYIDELLLFPSPEIAIETPVLDFTLLPGKTVRHFLQIANTGQKNLEYHLEFTTTTDLNRIIEKPLKIGILGCHPVPCEYELDIIIDQFDVNTQNQIAEKLNVYSQTLSLGDLLAFDAVFVCPVSNFSHPDSVGNILADYADQGGGIVLGPNCVQIGGRFRTQGYSPVTHESKSNASNRSIEGLGQIYFPGHSVLKGVNTVIGSFNQRTEITLVSDALTLCQWSHGETLVAIKQQKNRIAYVSIYPACSPGDSAFCAISSETFGLLTKTLEWTALGKYEQWMEFQKNSDTLREGRQEFIESITTARGGGLLGAP